MLTAEEKRWLVVGICLSKVLTPVLRKVIEKEIQQEFQKWIQPPYSIQSQTFDSHLEYLPPSTLRLNYININNNVHQVSRHSYDYGVRDELSLAKLFVKPVMAGFTAFDDSLDLSAALSVLCGAPNFVFSGVDIIAVEVRSEVRNEWGHCKFAMWTETYFDRCFQLLDNLIKTLNLPVASEAKVLEDFNEWKKRGIEMCFGQPIDNSMLKLVQDEMATLVSSVEANKETWMQDHKGLRKNLQKLTQLFGLEITRLEAKHVALESGLESLKMDHLKMKESVIENELATSSNATLIRNVKDTFGEEQKGLQSQHEVLEKKVTGLSQGMDELISKGNSFFKSGKLGLMWKIPIVVLCLFLLIILYEHYTKGTVLRYWYCRRGSLKGGHTLSFVFSTHDHQTPKVNGLEFSWENLVKKLNLAFDPHSAPGVHYYLNIDRCAYGGVIAVHSLLDNTPQVRGAEVFAVNADCTTVYYEQDGSWRPYISARNIRCISPNSSY